MLCGIVHTKTKSSSFITLTQYPSLKLPQSIRVSKCSFRFALLERYPQEATQIYTSKKRYMLSSLRVIDSIEKWTVMYTTSCLMHTKHYHKSGNTAPLQHHTHVTTVQQTIRRTSGKPLYTPPLSTRHRTTIHSLNTGKYECAYICMYIVQPIIQHTYLHGIEP